MKFVDTSGIEDQGSDINITPLIDVIFLLLIFFMVTTTFQETSNIKVNLPKTSETPPAKTEKVDLSVSIEANGSIYLGEKQVSLEALRQSIKERVLADQDSRLIVRADKATDHGKVVAVMNAAKLEGISKIAIATEQDAK